MQFHFALPFFDSLA